MIIYEGEQKFDLLISDLSYAKWIFVKQETFVVLKAWFLYKFGKTVVFITFLVKTSWLHHLMYLVSCSQTHKAGGHQMHHTSRK